MITSVLRRMSEQAPTNELAPACAETDHTLSRIRFGQATSWPEVRAAYALAYRAYVARGLIRPNAAELRFTHFNLLPDSATFVAKDAGRVVATLSLIPETPRFGLPMDALYQPELKELRGRKRRLAEGSGLAIHPEYNAVSLFLMMNLVKMAVAYSRKLGVTDDVIACHPKHGRFYKRVFLFEEVGGLRTYHAVNDAPAVALRLDVENLNRVYETNAAAHGPGIYRFFLSDEIFRTGDTALRAGAFSQDVRRHLCEAQPAVMAALEARDPGLVARLTGQPPSVCAPDRARGGVDPFLWEAPPTFVAA